MFDFLTDNAEVLRQPLLVVQIVVTVFLIIVVLMQRSEGGGLGFGGGGMGQFMTARGTANLLTRMTAILAAIFIITSLTLAVLARSRVPGIEVTDEDGIGAQGANADPAPSLAPLALDELEQAVRPVDSGAGDGVQGDVVQGDDAIADLIEQVESAAEGDTIAAEPADEEAGDTGDTRDTGDAVGEDAVDGAVDAIDGALEDLLAPLTPTVEPTAPATQSP